MTFLEQHKLHAYYINLDERTDRREEFEQRWKKLRLGDIERVPGAAIEADAIPRLPNGRYPGCYSAMLPHLSLLLQHLIRHEGYDAWILEDDNEFAEDFVPRFTKFLREVPQDWQMLWTGGYYRRVRKHHQSVCRALGVHYTNSYLVRRTSIGRLLELLIPPGRAGIDARLQNRVQPVLRCYCPSRPMTRQAASYSARVGAVVAADWGKRLRRVR